MEPLNMIDVPDEPQAVDYATRLPRKSYDVKHAVFAVIAGVLGFPPFFFGLWDIFPPYYDINVPVAFNGELVFNMSAFIGIGLLLWVLSFHWARMALSKE